MIVGIINGYYRSGTTIFQRFVELCEPSWIVLCEPTQHEIIYHIMRYGLFSVHPLHGFKIFLGYSKLPRNVLRDFIARHIEVFGYSDKNFGIFVDPDDALYLLEPLHDCEEKIVIKSTQLSLVLDEVVNKLGCWCIHLERATENTVFNHFPDLKAFLSFVDGYDKVIPFYGNLVYDRIVKTFDLNIDLSKPIEKLVFNVKFTNDYVKSFANKTERLTIIDFDNFVRNVDKYVNKLPFNARLDIAKELFSINRLNFAPSIVKEIVDPIIRRLNYTVTFNTHKSD